MDGTAHVPLQVWAAGWDIQISPGWNSSQDPKTSLRPLNSSGIQDGVVCAFKDDTQVQNYLLVNEDVIQKSGVC